MPRVSPYGRRVAVGIEEADIEIWVYDLSRGAVHINGRSLKSLHVTVIPMRSMDLGMSKGAAAVAFVVDPAQQVRPRTEILHDLFHMTPPECRVALLLSDGKSLPEIAQILGVSRNTLKTQVASVYSKTGISRQTQLVRLLEQFPQRSNPLADK
jgi:DNA-binding CsgD family transcriptional regulator